MLFSCDIKGSRQSTVISVDKGNNQSKHIILNPQRKLIYQYRLDNGIITQSPPNLSKCDYIVEAVKKQNNDEKTEHVFMIELKGKNIKHAYEQLTGTIKLFCNPKSCDEFHNAYKGSLNESTLHCRIIATKVGRPIPQTYERILLNQIKQLHSKYKNIHFDFKEKIVRQAGNSQQTTDTV